MIYISFECELPVFLSLLRLQLRYGILPYLTNLIRLSPHPTQEILQRYSGTFHFYNLYFPHIRCPWFSKHKFMLNSWEGKQASQGSTFHKQSRIWRWTPKLTYPVLSWNFSELCFAMPSRRLSSNRIQFPETKSFQRKVFLYSYLIFYVCVCVFLYSFIRYRI